jgi:methylmalonyl-CoA/ethylmalonyl-CoA epimerase
MPGTAFDHIAIGAARIVDAVEILVGRLGGVPASGGPGQGFRWASWQYAGGGEIEVIEPAGPGGFLHRFLADRGPGVHHVTFKVDSLGAACGRAEAAGYRLVGRDESDADWLVAYLHPKEALGIVVQLGQSSGRYGRRPWEVPPGPAAPPPARVLGLRLRARSAERARVQWLRALGGVERPGPDGALAFRWPGSPMRLVVEVVPDAEEGPVAIELGPERADLEGALPVGPASLLGTTFVVDRRTPEL